MPTYFCECNLPQHISILFNPLILPCKMFSVCGWCFSSRSSYSPLAKKFSQQFPGYDLPSMLAKFSLPVSLSEFRNPLEASVHEVSIVCEAGKSWSLSSSVYFVFIFWDDKDQTHSMYHSFIKHDESYRAYNTLPKSHLVLFFYEHSSCYSVGFHAHLSWHEFVIL